MYRAIVCELGDANQALVASQQELVQQQTDVDAARVQQARLQEELDELRRGWPPGHFYSPIPSIQAVKARESSILSVPSELPGIDLRPDAQRSFFSDLAQFSTDQPFAEQKDGRNRFYLDNPNFRHGEAVIYSCVIRLLRPKQILEIGSGFSSCLALDINERYMDSSIECTFIEPYPDLLLSLLHPTDLDAVSILPTRIQEVDLKLFETLLSGDILFIDSSHVLKTDSDVNFILFEILPRIAPGVYVHFHDIYYPFEYPLGWIYEGRAWNEAYAVRSFLQFNTAFEIVFFNSYFWSFHQEDVVAKMPNNRDHSGSSLWLRKVGA